MSIVYCTVCRSAREGRDTVKVTADWLVDWLTAWLWLSWNCGAFKPLSRRFLLDRCVTVRETWPVHPTLLLLDALLSIFLTQCRPPPSSHAQLPASSSPIPIKIQGALSQDPDPRPSLFRLAVTSCTCSSTHRRVLYSSRHTDSSTLNLKSSEASHTPSSSCSSSCSSPPSISPFCLHSFLSSSHQFRFQTPG